MQNASIILEENTNSTYTYLNIFRTSLYSFILVLGMFGNFTVVMATIKFITLRKPTNILICNLCVCDILILLAGIPLFAIEETDLKGVGCKLLSPFLTSLLTSTVLTLIVIALERYVIIVHHFQRFTFALHHPYTVIGCINIISLLTGVPIVFSFSNSSLLNCQTRWDETAELIYALFSFLMQYFLPLTSMCFLYARSWHRIRKKNKRTIRIGSSNRNSFLGRSASESDLNAATAELITKSVSNNHLVGDGTNLRRSVSSESVFTTPSPRRSRAGSFRESVTRAQRNLSSIITGADVESALSGFAAKRSRQTLLTLKMFTYIVLVFAVCMLPHHVIKLMHATDARKHKNYFHYLDFLYVCIYVNAAINPWIYGFMNAQYRIALRRLFLFKRHHVATMMERHLFRSPSGTLILSKSKSRRQKFCSLKLAIFCKRNKQDDVQDEILKTRSSEFENCRESSARSPLLSTSRKISKIHRNESVETTLDDIPLCLPIIIITCYDDEIENENAFRDDIENVNTFG